MNKSVSIQKIFLALILGMALLLPFPTHAPSQTIYPKYSIYKESAKTSATEVITLRLPTLPSKPA